MGLQLRPFFLYLVCWVLCLPRCLLTNQMPLIFCWFEQLNESSAGGREEPRLRDHLSVTSLSFLPPPLLEPHVQGTNYWENRTHRQPVCCGETPVPSPLHLLCVPWAGLLIFQKTRNKFDMHRRIPSLLSFPSDTSAEMLLASGYMNKLISKDRQKFSQNQWEANRFQ